MGSHGSSDEGPARGTLCLAGDERADRLLSADPLALLIGMVLDQQIPLERAFQGPAALVDRLGLAVPIDAADLAGIDPEALARAFAQRPSLHRYPAAMATRVQALAGVVADEYGGDAARIWKEADSGTTLRRRVHALPGFGDRKARIFVALLGKQFAVRPEGWIGASAPFGEPGSRLSVADIVDATTLAEVRTQKRQAKQDAKQARGSGG